MTGETARAYSGLIQLFIHLNVALSVEAHDRAPLPPKVWFNPTRYRFNEGFNQIPFIHFF